jgi:hypothetical protein
MIDNFALALSHGLLLLAAWRLLSRNDLDEDGAEGGENSPKRPFLKRPKAKAGAGKGA